MSSNRQTNLSHFMQLKGMTARELAKAVGTSETTIGRYVNGSREPKFNLACCIAKELGYSANDIFPFTGAK